MDTEQLSLFDLLATALGDQLPLIQATKATLVDVSHTLENLVLRERLPALIFTGFQESSHWRAETARYRELAGVAHQICIFAGGMLPGEDEQNQIHVRLRGPDPLRQEWFLLVLTTRFAAVLCGRDQLAPTLSEGDRRFDTLWTFTPDVIVQTLGLLRNVVARERPDRLADLEAAIARFPPPLPDAEIVTIFTSRLIDDLTRQHQARLLLERTLAYESRLRALGQVISGVAHELNNPLQSILGFAALIVDEPSLGPATRQDAQQVVAAAERAQAIVQELLQLARPVSNTLVATNLSELVSQTLIFVRADLATHGITLQFETEPELPPVVANRVRLQQMLINLLTNAMHALAKSPNPRLIQIHLKRAGQTWVELTLQDNGPGIAKDLQEHIFEPFFTTKPVGEGTGLGLSIVRTIVKEHEAALTLVSDVGQGTLFQIRLPASAAVASADPALVETSGRARILIIDDDSQVRALLLRVLQRAGYEVATAEATDAFQQMQSVRYDGVICDLLMPQHSGMQLYEQVRRHIPAMTGRIIFMTGDATRPATRAFLEQTGVAFVLKPFTTPQLLDALAKLLKAHD